MGDELANVLLGILANKLTWVLSAGGATFVLLPRLLWQLGGAREQAQVKLYASHREPVLTRAQALPVVGVGQVQALAAILPSLVRVYGWRWRQPIALRPADATIAAPDLTGNVIMLGGQSRNGATRKLLTELGHELGVQQRHGAPSVSGDCIRFRDGDGSWSDWLGGLEIDGTSKTVTEDYGLIMRVPNPWDQDESRRTCLVFAGVHTYGTFAAAQHFVRQWWKPMWWTRQGVIALVRVEVRDQHVTATERIFFRRVKLGKPSSAAMSTRART